MNKEEQKHLMQSYCDLHEKYYKKQQKNKQLKSNIETAINYIDQVIMYKEPAKELDEELNTLIGILKESDVK